MKSVLRFPVNTPMQVALREGTGRHVEGRYGEQVLYTLADDRVMYVPPIVEQRIEELAIATGELFEIVKHEVKEGSRRTIQWRVRRLPEQPELSADPPTDVPGISTAAASRANGDESGPAGPSEAAAPPNSNGKENGNGRGEPYHHPANGRSNGRAAPEKSDLPAIPEQITGTGIRAMELALNGAAEIGQRVENRAASKGYSLRFTSDDIRAIGLTIFIQAMRESVFGWQR